MTATSSSDRIDAARAALTKYDDGGEPLRPLADALRALIDAPETNDSPEQIATDLYWSMSDLPLTPNGKDIRGILAKGVRAGIQAAIEHDPHPRRHPRLPVGEEPMKFRSRAVISKRATCKNCKQPIKLLWTGMWTHESVRTDNQIGCISTTVAEPKKGTES